MRLSFSSLACPGWSVERIVEAAVSYGYDGVEWRLADGALLGPDTPVNVWQRIAGAGVQASCLDTSCVFVRKTDEERDAVVREAVTMAERAISIGAPAIRVFGGPLPEGRDRDAVVTETADALSRAVAGCGGIRLLVETHDAWSRGADAWLFISDVVGAGVLWDVAHTTRAGETPEETLKHIGAPGLVHVKDAKGKQLTHLGDGDVPLKRIVTLLRDLGYGGWLSLEWEKLWHPELDDADVVLPRAAAYLADLVGRP